MNFFNRVALDPEVHTPTWPTSADFDPATLHDWLRIPPRLPHVPSNGTARPLDAFFVHQAPDHSAIAFGSGIGGSAAMLTG